MDWRARLHRFRWPAVVAGAMLVVAAMAYAFSTSAPTDRGAVLVSVLGIAIPTTLWFIDRRTQRSKHENTPRELKSPASSAMPYRATLEEIARRTPQLRDRDEDLNLLRQFVRRAAEQTPCRLVTGPPWSGKTALLAHFALAPPDDVDVVAYFLVRRWGTANSEHFVSSVVEQLAWLLDERRSSSDHDVYRELWAKAVEQSAQVGRQLLLIVDGLDEDDSRDFGLPSVVSLLPTPTGETGRVLVAGRNRSKVDPADPLWNADTIPLAPSPHTRDLEARASHELDDILTGAGKRPQQARRILGTLAASEGPLSIAELHAFTGLSAADVRAVLHGIASRVLTRDPAGTDNHVAFSHDTLRNETERKLEETGELEGYRANIIETTFSAIRQWSPRRVQTELSYAYRGLPLLLARRSPGQLVDLLGNDDFRAAAAAALDADMMREMHLWLSAARSSMLRQATVDIAALARLAFEQERLAFRADVPVELPSLWAMLSGPAEAMPLADALVSVAARARAYIAMLEVIDPDSPYVDEVEEHAGSAAERITELSVRQACFAALVSELVKLRRWTGAESFVKSAGTGAWGQWEHHRRLVRALTTDQGPEAAQALVQRILPEQRISQGIAWIVEVLGEQAEFDKADVYIRRIADEATAAASQVGLARAVAEREPLRAKTYAEAAEAATDRVGDGRRRISLLASVAKLYGAFGDWTEEERVARRLREDPAAEAMVLLDVARGRVDPDAALQVIRAHELDGMERPFIESILTALVANNEVERACAFARQSGGREWLAYVALLVLRTDDALARQLAAEADQGEAGYYTAEILIQSGALQEASALPTTDHQRLSLCRALVAEARIGEALENASDLSPFERRDVAAEAAAVLLERGQEADAVDVFVGNSDNVSVADLARDLDRVSRAASTAVFLEFAAHVGSRLQVDGRLLLAAHALMRGGAAHDALKLARFLPTQEAKEMLIDLARIALEAPEPDHELARQALLRVRRIAGHEVLKGRVVRRVAAVAEAHDLVGATRLSELVTDDALRAETLARIIMTLPAEAIHEMETLGDQIWDLVSLDRGEPHQEQSYEVFTALLRTKRWERAELVAHQLFGDDVPRALTQLAVELHEVDPEGYTRILHEATSGAGDWAFADVVGELVEAGLAEDAEELADAMNEGPDKDRAMRRIHPPPADTAREAGQFFWQRRIDSAVATMGITESVERARGHAPCSQVITSFVTALATYSIARARPNDASQGYFRRALDDLVAEPECWPLAAELCSAVRDDLVQLLGWTMLATSALQRKPAMSAPYLESVQRCADRAAGAFDLVTASALTTLAQSVLDNGQGLDQRHVAVTVLVSSVLTSTEWQAALPVAQRLDDTTVPAVVEAILREANRQLTTSDAAP